MIIWTIGGHRPRCTKSSPDDGDSARSVYFVLEAGVSRFGILLLDLGH